MVAKKITPLIVASLFAINTFAEQDPTLVDEPIVEDVDLKSSLDADSYVEGLYGHPQSKSKVHIHLPDVFFSWLSFSYDQTMFWVLREESHPFSNIDFAPKIILGSVILNKRHHFWITPFEHRSNGRASDLSRSINSFGVSYYYSHRWNDWALSSEASVKKFYAHDPSNQDYQRFGDAIKLKINVKRVVEHLQFLSQTTLDFGVDEIVKFSNWNQRLELSFLSKTRWPTFVLESSVGYNENFLHYNKYEVTIRGGIKLGL